MSYDPTALAAMAAKLRSGARRPDPQVVAVSRQHEDRDKYIALAAALGSDVARRQPAAPTRAEAAEIDRVVREQAEWFGATGEDEHPR